MKYHFFLPTVDEWYGTYEGGYVEVFVGDELNPEFNQIRIGFWGNDDTALIKDSEKYHPEESKEKLRDALEYVLSMPLPITKGYLRKEGFDPF
jgi:hypothetical protein